MSDSPGGRSANPSPGPRVVFVAVLILLAAGLSLRLDWPALAGAPARLIARAPISAAPPPEINPQAIISVLPKDSIRAIDDPRFEPASQAAQDLDPDERLIGVVINGEARAYPIPILSAHEIVNDVVGGEPIAVSWCPLCYTALVFSRRVEGVAEPLTFGVSGKLLYNTLVMYDRQTDTLWSQLYGAGVEGALAGSVLQIFPSQHTEWSAWRGQYSDSLVLSKRLTCEQFACGTFGDNPRGSYAVDPYESYYSTPLEGIVDYQIPREEVNTGPKARVLGVRIGNRARAYPFDVLKGQPLVQDQIGEVPVLVWFDPETETGVAFGRLVEGQVLTFGADPTSPGTLWDLETGSRWQATSGLSDGGPLRGHQLPAVFATPAFAFGWFDYFPHSDTYTD